MPVKKKNTNLARSVNFGFLLFILSLIIYSITRLYALDRFPINFFADEANQVVVAKELVKNGFRDSQGHLFPMYFYLFYFYYPSISVYFHAISSSLFGVSIIIARATSASLTILSAIAIGFILKSIFRARFFWTVVFFLALSPFWFLFSRTAFDPVAMASFYPVFILFYLLYRYKSPKFIYPALLFGAFTFYAYPTGQTAIVLLSLFLLISDIRYYIRQYKHILLLIPLACILTIPFIRFYQSNPKETYNHLHSVDSYLVKKIPSSEKLHRFSSNYLTLLSPSYWFSPDPPDLIRHKMKNYSFLPVFELPFLAVGIIKCLINFHKSKYRTVLASLLVLPVGAAISEPAIIRELAFIAPFAIISTLGIEWILSFIKNKSVITVTSIILFVILTVMSFSMLKDVLVNGPLWYKDYGLYGMQWGAKQIFQDAIPGILKNDPQTKIMVASNWANGTEIFPRFFLNIDDQKRVTIGDIDYFLFNKHDLNPKIILVATPEEYQKAGNSNKFKEVQVEKTIAYPDGTPGFYFLKLAYRDDIDQIFQEEIIQRRKSVTETLMIDGEKITVIHSPLDMGKLENIQDNDPFTLIRGMEANPFIMEFIFPKAKNFRKMNAYFGVIDNITVTVKLYPIQTADPIVYTQNFRNLKPDQFIDLFFKDGPPLVSKVHLEIKNNQAGEMTNIHIWELKFL